MTTKELNRRKRIVRAVIGSQELEGVHLDPATKRTLEAFANGHLSATDLLAKVRKSEKEVASDR